jgi:ATP dependent DNA ligase-like protein
MPIEFCLPTSGKAVPSGPDWIHEVKYDGYGLRVERHGERVKTSRGGLDWTRRFPWIAETARKIRKTRFIIDGEAVVLGVDGISDSPTSMPCTPASTTRSAAIVPSAARA